MRYTFTEADCKAAYEEWGCNCGPAALAFALQVSLSAVQHQLDGFDMRRYTNPTMMEKALQLFKATVVKLRAPQNLSRDCMFAKEPSLVRIQWTGPWTADGRTQKWAARQTHWVCAYKDGEQQLVFDINGGICTFSEWKREIVPAITATIPRADGGWWPANVWRISL